MPTFRYVAQTPEGREVRGTVQANSRFKPGDKVVHPRFGQGLVLRSTPTRDDEEVEVFFFDAGGKRLSATMSGLKKLKE